MDMKSIRHLLFCFPLIFLVGCTHNRSSEPSMTQLQIREFQTRVYDTKDTKMVMKAMINVLQDDEYIVKSADLNLGLLSATKEVDVENLRKAFFAKLLAGEHADWEKNVITEASANISEFGEQTKVRINFREKIMSSKGAVQKVEAITNPDAYQEFFSKVDKGIFVQKEGI